MTRGLDAPDEKNEAPANGQHLSGMDWSPDSTGRDRLTMPNTTHLAYTIDRKFFRIVVLFAGWTLVLAVGGMVFLAANEKPIPEGIVAAASGLIGLLTGTFAAKNNRL